MKRQVIGWTFLHTGRGHDKLILSRMVYTTQIAPGMTHLELDLKVPVIQAPELVCTSVTSRIMATISLEVIFLPLPHTNSPCFISLAPLFPFPCSTYSPWSTFSNSHNHTHLFKTQPVLSLHRPTHHRTSFLPLPFHTNLPFPTWQLHWDPNTHDKYEYFRLSIARVIGRHFSCTFQVVQCLSILSTQFQALIPTHMYTVC